ncbi:hypothetical protein [Crocosphaera sp. Alani8]|uniref:hypothetical protein n=1 Tax=Crocosphaera sp. Alani8 TaxID=3038952 RepID=UPI00313DB029
MHINIHELKDGKNQIVATKGTLRKPKDNAVMTIFLIVLSSLVLGLLPLIYGFTLTSSSSKPPTVPHESILWNSFNN